MVKTATIPGLTMQDTRNMTVSPKVGFAFRTSKNKSRLGAAMPAATRNKVPVVNLSAEQVSATADDTSEGYTTNSDILNTFTPTRIKLYIEFEFDMNNLAVNKFIEMLESCAPGSKAVVRHVEAA